MIRNRITVKVNEKGNQQDLLLSLIKDLITKAEEKKLESYVIERFMEKSSPNGEWETYKLTGKEEVRVMFEAKEEKDGG